MKSNPRESRLLTRAIQCERVDEGERGGENALIFFGIYKTSSKRSRKFPFLDVDVDVDSLYFSLLVREVEIGIVLLPFLPSCLSFFVSYNEHFIRNYHAIFSFDG